MALPPVGEDSLKVCEKLMCTEMCLKVTTFSLLYLGGVLPTVLQEVRVPIVSNDKCKNMFLSAGRHEYIPDIFMCAGYDEGGRDSCQASDHSNSIFGYLFLIYFCRETLVDRCKCKEKTEGGF